MKPLRLLMLALLACIAAGAQAQTYPNRPVRLVVGFAPGGSTDVFARALAIPLAKERNEMFAYALWAILAVYVPGSYILFSHMLAQRRKIARQNRRV